MDYVQDDKPSKRSLYRQRAKHLKVDEVFEDEDLPEEVAYFHRIFFEIWDQSRGLTYQNLYYWQRLYGVSLESDVIDMFKDISGKCNEFVIKKMSKPGK